MKQKETVRERLTEHGKRLVGTAQNRPAVWNGSGQLTAEPRGRAKAVSAKGRENRAFVLEVANRTASSGGSLKPTKPGQSQERFLCCSSARRRVTVRETTGSALPPHPLARESLLTEESSDVL